MKGIADAKVVKIFKLTSNFQRMTFFLPDRRPCCLHVSTRLRKVFLCLITEEMSCVNEYELLCHIVLHVDAFLIVHSTSSYWCLHKNTLVSLVFCEMTCV